MKTQSKVLVHLIGVCALFLVAATPARSQQGDLRTYARVTVRGLTSPIWLSVDWQVGGHSGRTPYASLGKRQLAANVAPPTEEWLAPGASSGWCDLTAALDHAVGSPAQYPEHTITFTLKGTGLLFPAEVTV